MIHVIDPVIRHPRLDLFDGIVYSNAETFSGRRDLKMMIMKESMIGQFGKKIEPKPCILWVMGGGWAECPREKAIPFLTSFAKAGYVIASATYRTSSEAVWPAQIQDVQTAIRFLRAHADQHGIDPERIAIMGLSAGGHLTAVQAMNPEGYETEEWSGYSSDVQAAVDMFGPTDLAKFKEDNEISAIPSPYPSRRPEGADVPAGMRVPPEDKLCGGTPEEVPEVMRDASPIYHINEKACPLLIMHGRIDAMVSLRQSERLYDMMTEAGMEPEFYILENTGHGFHQFFQDDVIQIMIGFLDEHLK